jgi:hypothetical protein
MRERPRILFVVLTIFLTKINQKSSEWSNFILSKPVISSGFEHKIIFFLKKTCRWQDISKNSRPVLIRVLDVGRAFLPSVWRYYQPLRWLYSHCDKALIRHTLITTSTCEVLKKNLKTHTRPLPFCLGLSAYFGPGKKHVKRVKVRIENFSK